MSMTRQDFRVIAEVFREFRPQEVNMHQRMAQWVLLRDEVAYALTRHARGFDREKFVAWTERPFNARSQG